MRQRFHSVTRGFSWLSLVLLFLACAVSAGCALQTRGAMYLQKERVGVYLDKTKRSQPPKGIDLTTYLIWRGRLGEMPDGNRILGGFCTDEGVVPVLEAIDGLRPTCQKRLYKEASAANYQGKLFWGFLGFTLSSGAVAIGMGAGALAASDTGTKDILGFMAAGFGAAAFVSALVNGFGGFDARQEKYKLYTRRIDNFMWSLRQRVIVEVCNAKSRGAAVQQIVYIYNMTKRYCTSGEAGDGTYRIPTGSSKFDSKSLPDTPPPKSPERVAPPAVENKQPVSREEPKAKAKERKPASRTAPAPRQGTKPAPREETKPAPRQETKPAPRK